MNSIKKFIETHPDMKFIVGMYLMGSKEQFGEDCQFEIAMDDKEENEFVQKYQKSGYSLVDNNYFGEMRKGLKACFMVFKKKEDDA